MKIRTRVCPVCEHVQSASDPTRHVCIQVLREKLLTARAELNAIRMLVESEDALGGTRRLKQLSDSLPAQVHLAVSRGRASGHREAVQALLQTINHAPRWKRLFLVGQYRLIETLHMPRHAWNNLTRDDA